MEFDLLFTLSDKKRSDKIIAFRGASSREELNGMRFLKAVVIIFGITMLGEFLNYLLPLPVPAGVYGLFILLALLCAGIVKLDGISDTGNFFLDVMPLMFIPAGVGLLNSVEELKEVLVPLTVITAVSTVFVMAATGRAAQYMIRRSQGKKEGKARVQKESR